VAYSSRASRARTCAHAPSSTTSARSRAYLRADSRKSPAGIIWDAARCRSIYDIRRFVDGGTITFRTWTRARTWTWTRARWERGHMAHGAVWLRVRTLSVLLWRRERTTCWGLADWWNLIVSVEHIQARGLGYVHFERVGPRTSTFDDTGSLSSSFTFFYTFESPPCVDHGRRVRSGVRTLKQTVSAVFATLFFFFFLCVVYIILLYLLASPCVRVCSFSSFFFRSRRFGSQFVIPLYSRTAGPSRIKCRATNWRMVAGHLGGITKALSCCTIRSAPPLLPCKGEASHSLAGLPNRIGMADGPLLPLLTMLHWYVWSSKTTRM
jgi:hypothetical protein